jgi:post-segregation antitoxin (ccd killing protein)
MLKNRERIGSAIDKELLEQLREYSKDSKIPISKLLDEAIEDLLKKRKAR